MSIRTYTELRCWQDAQLLFREIYLLFKSTPSLRHEYVLKDQISRASLSVMNNIAEGFGRFSNKEFLRFLNIARGSCYEVESMIHTMELVGLINPEYAKHLLRLTSDIRKSLGGLSKFLHSTVK